MDIVCLGEPMIEFNRQDDGRWLEGFGGDVSNVAIAAARQGAKVAMLTALGTDQFGDMIMDLWHTEGVDTRYVTRHPDAPTGIYFVDHDERGHSFSYRRAGSAAALMRPADLDAAAITGARLLHLSGISQAISPTACDTCFAAMDTAKDVGVPVSYDLNYRARLWPLARARAVIHEAVAMATIALPGFDDASALSGLTDPAAILDFYAGLGPRVVALTLGADGAMVREGERTHAVPPFPTEAVDASGAGDCFDGAFLVKWLEAGDAAAAARTAACAAALSVRGYGAVAPIPTAEAVAAALAAEA
ncbi:sugar kinase [Acuticoccus sp. I52.16.1]|uniref:sugar kinase n=1 Tax=Acuticoccus sp. I52.16.1 TaxID=2928472 RepID=UPI001FD447B1|nr:sugar kinase [Acuticoccus sp. I52.16.1]UOM35076.1 sugar kinase [Acuticoccus sp. I52.16.1]